MEKILDKVVNGSTDFLLKLIVSIIIIIIGIKLINLLEKALKKEHKLAKLDPSVKTFVISFVSLTLKLFVFVVALINVGIPSATIITLFGSAALAIGLALQGGLSNLAGGLMILIFKPFRVGDYIGAGSNEGTVKSITMFYTTLVTIDNKTIQLPNGNLSNSDIVNYTANNYRMINFDISVGYNSDIEKVKKVLTDVANSYELTIKEKEIKVRLKEMADSSLVFIFRCWVKTSDYWIAFYDLKEQVKKTLDKNKIEIPYPKMDINIKNK